MIISPSFASRSATSQRDDFKSASKADSNLFRAETLFKGEAFFPPVVEQQISLVGEKANTSRPWMLTGAEGTAKATHQSAANASFLQLAALMPQEQLNTMSDAGIKALFAETTDPELKRQLGTEASLRRQKAETAPPASTDDQDNSMIAGFITIDDLNTAPSKMEPIFQFLKKNSLPVTFFPINEKSRIDDMKNVELNLARVRKLGLNFKIGQHGYSGDKLDPLMPGANGKTIAWPYGKVVVDELPHDAVARGVRCGVNQWGSFDQHNLNSCTVSSDPKEIATRRAKIYDVKRDGGSLGFHMHNSDGFTEFEEDYQDLKKAGAEFMFMDNLIGKGADK